MKLLHIFIIFLLFQSCSNKMCQYSKKKYKICGVRALKHMKVYCTRGMTRDYGKLLVTCCSKGCNAIDIQRICL
ncbi:INSulin related [Caenorhabditis elegans]|uniref:INSulin related n=1 Tax=Caenorhabditis elegans TaxID=6239 RepID=Q7JP48_CAEEL|nr:INSulin related [Caenorhabditis elegans]CCD64848.1 INSulin related [Caenorhabditis elegans]|eukprot:NP_001021962.1 INSulin related [Caenorhabditis elegans]